MSLPHYNQAGNDPNLKQLAEAYTQYEDAEKVMMQHWVGRCRLTSG